MKFRLVIIIAILLLSQPGFCLVVHTSYHNRKLIKYKPVQITIMYTQATKGDTLSLYYYENPLDSRLSEWNEKEEKCIHLKAPYNQEGIYRFRFLPKQEFGYVSIRANETYAKSNDTERLIYNDMLLTESGDNVRIKVKESGSIENPDLFKIHTFQCSGPSGRKYQLQFLIDSLVTAFKGGLPFRKNGSYNSSNYFDRGFKVALETLESNKPMLNQAYYNMLKSNIIFSESRFEKYKVIKRIYEDAISKKDSSAKALFKKGLDSVIRADNKTTFPEEILFQNGYYSAMMLYQLMTLELFKTGKVDDSLIFEKIKNDYHGRIRDKLWITFFQSLTDESIPAYNAMLDYAISHLYNKNTYSGSIEQLVHRMSGSKAFNFSLTDTDGKIVHLSDFKGKVVFIDFWFTGCSFCREYYKDNLHYVEDKFKGNSNVVFISISIDKGMNFWKESVKSGLYTSNEAINLFTNGQADHNPTISYYDVHAYPYPIIISKNGRLTKFSDSDLLQKNTLIDEINKALTTTTN